MAAAHAVKELAQRTMQLCGVESLRVGWAATHLASDFCGATLRSNRVNGALTAPPVSAATLTGIEVKH